MEKREIQVVREDRWPVTAQIIWPAGRGSRCRLIGFDGYVSGSGGGSRFNVQDVRPQEKVTAKDIDLEIGDGFEGQYVVVVYWGKHWQNDGVVKVVAFDLEDDQGQCQRLANPETVLSTFFRQIETLSDQCKSWQKMVGGLLADEHLVALRRSKESLVRLAGDKMAEKILELGITLGLDWQTALTKLQASIRPTKK